MFISSNPYDNLTKAWELLDVESEAKEIRKAIQISKYRDSINITESYKTKTTEIIDLVLHNQPDIIHFSGHGSKKGLVFNDYEDNFQVIKNIDLSKVVKSLDYKLKVIFLNACYSDHQGKILSNYSDCVIGTTDEISDNDAILFASKFYEEIGNGNSINQSFKIASMHLELKQTPNVFKLIISSEVDSNELFILGKEALAISFLKDMIEENKKAFFGSYNEFAIIKNRFAIKVNMKKYWTMEDDEIEKEFSDRKVKANKLFSEFMQDPLCQKLIVGAPFGTGKSFLIRELFEKFANSRISNVNEYFPILINLKHGLNIIVKGRSLTLNHIIRNILDDYSRNNTKLIIMLDGLDEYIGDRKSLFDDINRDIIFHYPKTKIIITSRLNAGYPKSLGLESVDYIRILPFEKTQVDEYFYNSSIDLSYTSLLSMGLSHEEITKPLFTWMISIIHPKIHLAIDLIKYDNIFSSQIRKSLFYFHLFYYILLGRYHELNGNEDYLYIVEKKLLRRISILMQIHNDQLDRKTLESEKRIIGLDSIKLDIEPILSTYISFKDSKEILEFGHKTFKEYLIAEYYLENLLKDELPILLNSEIPSKETIDFLQGLIELLKAKKPEIREYVYKPDDKHKNLQTLFGSFEYDTSIKLATEKIISNSKDIIFNKDLLSTSNDISNIAKMFNDRQISLNSFKNVWLFKWISFFVIFNFDSYTEELKEHLIELIKSSSQFIPGYIKIMDNVDLSNSDLSCCNLSNTKISNANFSNVNLSYSDLSNSEISGVTFNDANISFCNLQNTKFYNCKFIGSVVSFTDLNKAEIKLSNLTFTNFSSSDLSSATFTECDLSKVEWENSNQNKMKIRKSK